MKRERRKLDMLPLLDVFMVVLFVFATIQEGRLDSTTQEAQEQASELEETKALSQELKEALQSTQQENQALKEENQSFQQTKRALDAERQENAEMLTEIAELREAQTQTQAALAEAQNQNQELIQKAKQKLKQAFDSDDAFRQQEIMEKLLDQNSVFEVEIHGIIDAEKGVINHCCFRDDPRATSWQSCGVVPAKAEDRSQWFRNGAEGLLDTLRRTKGGNAMTIIRQNPTASHQISGKVEDAIREYVPDQKVYNEGISFVEMHCNP